MNTCKMSLKRSGLPTLLSLNQVIEIKSKHKVSILLTIIIISLLLKSAPRMTPQCQNTSPKISKRLRQPTPSSFIRANRVRSH